MSARIDGPPRVALYARYSSDRQSEHSIEDQLRICQAHADREGWAVVAEFRDAAISGATMLRPGYQALQAAMRAGEFDIVLGEALDRFSRDQEHVAALFKLTVYAEVRLVTLSEGEVGPLHVGMKGTMNALFLKDLTTKTRRGIEGRVRAGRGTGVISYGYRRILGVLRPDGEVERGLREIDPDQAVIVRRIFSEFVAGLSPTAIARRLNQDRIPAPKGVGWNQFSIRGRAKTGDGMLRNRIYVGETVWNRRHHVIDPSTGKRAKRANSAVDHVVVAAPELRIIDDALWAKAQARLASESVVAKVDGEPAKFWEKRRPKHLLSGKIVCGACGGPFSAAKSIYYSCNAAQRRVCTNRSTVNRVKLEKIVLDVLTEKMMDPELAEAFATEFTVEWNRLAAEAGLGEARLRRELDAVERQLANLVEAISNGLKAATLQQKLTSLEAEQERLSREVARSKPSRVRLLPNLGIAYRHKLAELRQAVSERDDTEALERARALIARIVVHPAPPRKPPGIVVEAGLAALLTTAQPDLPPEIAAQIAETASVVVKEGARGQSPLASSVKRAWKVASRATPRPDFHQRRSNLRADRLRHRAARAEGAALRQ